MTKQRPFWDNITKGNNLFSLIASIIAILTYFGSSEARNYVNRLFTIARLSTLNSILALCILALILYLLFKRPRKRGGIAKSNILDLDDARKIVAQCQTPKTTEELRRNYDYSQSQSRWVVLGGYNFNDYIQRLEEEGCLIHNPNNSKWSATEKAIEYIRKYHGY